MTDPRARRRRPVLKRLEGRRLLSTFTVNTTADSGPGSLRAAILGANGTVEADTINFAIIGPGRKTIAPATPLPTIDGTVLIDGITQPGSTPKTSAQGFNATLNIVLDGSGAGTSHGLVVTSAGVVIRGLVIHGFAQQGIQIEGGASGRVEGCMIGLTADGLGTKPNGGSGIVVVNSAQNTIGGADVAARNLIAGNRFSGVMLQSSSQNVVLNNFIGLRPAPLAALPNGTDGITLINSSDNLIGTPGTGNVISGQGRDGVAVINSSTRNVIRSNRIGTDPSGTQAVGNARTGLFLANALDNTIGGPTAADSNLISGNLGDGIVLDQATDTWIQGNRLGTDLGGAAALPNEMNGVFLSNGTVRTQLAGNHIANNHLDGVAIHGAASTGNWLRANVLADNQGDGVHIEAATGNEIGGPAASDGNTIRNNAGSGVALLSGINNRIRSNAISGNAGLGIALGPKSAPPAPLPNDSGDSDLGANNLQNTPVITTVTVGNDRILPDGSHQRLLTIIGTISGTPSAALTLQFFGAAVGGVLQGQTLLGSTTVVTDPAGHASFATLLTVVDAGTVSVPGAITATATDTAGNTSEFAPVSPAPQPATAALTLAPLNPPATAEINGTITYSFRVTNPGPAFATDLALLDLVPPGLTFLGGNVSQGIVVPVGGSAAALLGTLAPGGSAVVNFVFRADAVRSMVHNLVLAASEGSTTATVATAVQQPVPQLPPPLQLTRATWLSSKRGGTQVQLTFSRPLLAQTATQTAYYRVVVPGRDKRFGTRDDQLQKIKSITLDATGTVVTLLFRAKLNPKPKYQLTVTGGPSSGVMDALLRALDGDRDGSPGGHAAVQLIPKGTVTVAAAIPRGPSGT